MVMSRMFISSIARRITSMGHAEPAMTPVRRLERSKRWNSGCVEGHVNKLKVVKRQMFGRARFDLLRKRVLLAN